MSSARRLSRSDLASRAWSMMSGWVTTQDRDDELREALGLGRGTGRVRALLALANDPLSLGGLARAIGVDPPYATVIVNELQALGLLLRIEDPRDRRRRSVKLTDAGLAAVATARQIIDRPPPALADLPDAELVKLHEILETLTAS